MSFSKINALIHRCIIIAFVYSSVYLYYIKLFFLKKYITLMSQPSFSCSRTISFLRILEHINIEAVISQRTFMLLLQISVDVMWYDIWYIIWYDMMWYDIWHIIWYDVIWCDMIYDMICDIWYVICDIWYMIYDMIWYDMIWYDMIWYDMIWYDMIWYYMIWYVIWYVIFVNCNWVYTRWQ